MPGIALTRPPAGRRSVVHASGLRLHVLFPAGEALLERPAGTEDLLIRFDDGASIELRGFFTQDAATFEFEVGGGVLSRTEFLEAFAPGGDFAPAPPPETAPALRNCHAMPLGDPVSEPLMGSPEIQDAVSGGTRGGNGLPGFLDDSASLADLLRGAQAAGKGGDPSGPAFGGPVAQGEVMADPAQMLSQTLEAADNAAIRAILENG